MAFKTVPLSQILDMQNGFAFKSAEYSDEGYFVMRIANVQDGYVSLKDPKYIRIEENSRLKSFVLNSGDILMSLTGNVGRVGIIDELHLPAVLNQRVARIKITSNSIEKKYLFNFLNSAQFRTQVERLSHGAAQMNVSTTDIVAIEIPLPPLPVQKAIVAKLDAAFASIEQAIAAAERNAENAKQLFQSYLREVYGKGDNRLSDTEATVINSWTTVTLGDVCEMYQPKTIATRDLKADGKYTVYGANGVIGRYDQYNHVEAQLLVTCRGATCGAVNVSAPFSWINGNAMVVKPKQSELDVRFLEYLFKGALDISTAITGAAQPQITRQSLSPLKFSYPPLQVQKEIVAKLDEISIQTMNLATSYTENFIAWKQSLLRQAFNGQLVDA
jgi:type I restriction enzyme, S subunit